MKACPSCRGTGWSEEIEDGLRIGARCKRCAGRAELPVTQQEVRRWHRMLKLEAPLQPLNPPPTLIVVTLTREESA